MTDLGVKRVVFKCWLYESVVFVNCFDDLVFVLFQNFRGVFVP
jgi:hypothetical protein